MKLLFRILDRIMETAILITLASMSGVVAVNVFCRFVLNFSLSWGDEVAMMLMVWLTFLGAAVGMRDNLAAKTGINPAQKLKTTQM